MQGVQAEAAETPEETLETVRLRALERVKGIEPSS